MSAKKLLKRYLIIMIIASLVVSALIGIIVLLVGTFGVVEGKILATTLVVGVFSITGLAGIRNMESVKRGYVLFAFTSVALSVAALLVFMSMIWFEYSSYPWKLASSLAILSVSSAHISLLLPVMDSATINYIKVMVLSTIVCIIAVAGILIGIVTLDEAFQEESVFRLLGVFAILDALGTIVSPIAAKVTSKK